MDEKNHWRDWTVSLLVIFLVGVVAARLSVTNWSPNLWMMNLLALFGVVLGLLLGSSRFRWYTILWMSVFYSGFFLIWQLGAIIGEKIQWGERLRLLYERLQESLTLFWGNQPVSDPMLFLAFMGLLIWCLALATGFYAARNGNPWGSLILLAGLMIIVDYYHPFLNSRNRYTGLFFFLTLLLIARFFLLHSRYKWAKNVVMEDSEIGIHLTKWMVVVSLVFVLLAWNLPVLFQALTPGSPIQRRWEKNWEIIRDRLSNAVAGLSNTEVVVSNFYGDTIQLGQRAATGDETIFTIEVPKSNTAEQKQYYWKATSYDFYDGSEWRSTFSDQILNPTNDWQVKSESFEEQTALTLNITSLLPLSRTIISPGTPLNFNRSVQAQLAPAAKGEFDILGLRAEPPLNQGEIYRVQARIPEPTAKQLRDAGEDYPEWIIDRYLGLPEEISPRVVALASELTSDLDNSFDKVTNITNYLRQTITYEEEMERPPIGKDVMEWFLFDYQKGFCNYYASAEVLLLRSIGVPARLSVGFASGEINEIGSVYTVRKKDSHAWPEVYFVGIGWVEFEPTTAQPMRQIPEEQVKPDNSLSGPNIPPPIVMDEGESPTPEDQESTETSAVQRKTKIGGITLAWILVIFFFVTIPVAFFLRFYPLTSKDSIWVLLEQFLISKKIKVPTWLNQLASGRDNHQMHKMIRWINRLLLWLGVKPNAGMTAAERISTLIKFVPQMEEPGKVFLREYELFEYSTRFVDMKIAVKAIREIKSIFIKNFLRQLARRK